jgi:sugar transferase EpsL
MKRIFDVIFSVAFLILLLPIIFVVAVAVLYAMGGPVLFGQIRPGLHNKPFKMLKFRTMNNARDSFGNLLDDEQRLTKTGRFLRAASLDELPGLWNVLIGDMSLVGPRPLLMQYLPLYSPEQKRRHEVKPGLTGWAQINGRNAISWDDKFALDVWYVDHRTFTLDIYILLKTAVKVCIREGINGVDGAVMPPFEGSNTDKLKNGMGR